MRLGRIACYAGMVLVFAAACRANDPLPPIKTVEIDANRAFRVNGRPFFPIMAWLQDAANFAAVKDCGMNVTAGYWPASSGTKDVAEYLALVEKAGLYGVMPFDAGLKGHPSLLGYIHGDEPDLPHQVNDADGKNVLPSPPRHEPRTLPEQTLREYRGIKSADPARPVFMTLTGYFHPHFQKWSDEQRASLYPQYIRAADVVGYDIYPIYGWNKPEWLYLVYDATRLLAENAGPRPVYAWIETSKGGQWTGPLDRQKDVTPAHIRAETWMAICGGATGIGYFTHVWKPSYRQFGVPEENRHEIRAINDQITRLAPVILGRQPGESIAIEAAGKTKLAVMAREHEDGLYLFAVNYDERGVEAEATVTVESLQEGTEVTVIDEDRGLHSSGGSFTDVFGPLAVHVYRIAWEK